MRVKYKMGVKVTKSLLWIAGQFPVYLITASSLGGLLVNDHINLNQFIEILFVVSSARFILSLLRGPKPVFENRLVRYNIKRLIVDESRIAFIFLASCFLFNWTIEIKEASVFILANYIGQCGGLFLTNRIRKWLLLFSSNEKQVKKVIIAGTSETAKEIADRILNSPETELSIIGFMDYKKKGFWSYRDLPLIGHPEDIERIGMMQQLDGVIIAVEKDELLFAEKLFETAENLGLTVCFAPDIFRPKIYNSRPAYISGKPVMVYRRIPENQTELFIKELIDKSISIAILTITAPILFLIGMAIKFDSKGPVIFSQTRSGVNGRKFKLYKFRTMVNDAEKKKKELSAQNEMSGPVFKIKNDPRVTRVGSLLRKTSLDEFPQFLNVLKGDMTLVGPRPPLPNEVASYEPWQRRRLSVKPGITCTWQVNGRNQIDFDDWMKLDLDYIDNWSLLKDAEIMAKTVPAVLKGDGAS